MTSPTYDAPIVVEPAQPASATVIWLHGLGADGRDFEPVVPMLESVARYTRFVFPHAARQPVTINGGMVMRAWYDIISTDIERRADANGIRDSEAYVHTLINAERQAGIDESRMVLAGFSQGGAIALHTGLRYPTRLAGIMALSTYVPLREFDAQEAHPANQDTPIFYAHGSYDAVVPMSLAEGSRDHLQALGYSVEWHAYPMEHTLAVEEVRDTSIWLAGVIPAS